ncbi:MAG: hydantoinase/oxoprolinase family protein [Thermoleophilaceae bacterium]
MRLAVDTGGTFTDLVVSDGSALRLYKAPTTPENPPDGVFDALGRAAADMGIGLAELLGGATDFIHATTHPINALLTGGAARTALLVTEGHPDILLFREGGRADPFDFSTPYPDPLIPRALTFEVPERIGSSGEVVRPLDEDALGEIFERLREEAVEAVAVSFLWSIVNPAHEARVGELLAEQLPGVPVSLSHAVNPSLREYRRTSSTGIDAALKPLMSEYFRGLIERLRGGGFDGRALIVTSQGGVMEAEEIASKPIHSVNSGPAMAPVAGRHYAALDTDAKTAIIADTGGTTFDVSLVRDGQIPWTRETWIGAEYQGNITGFPSVDVKSVGAGGGSIARVDEGGLLHVGPESAGATPGPACYGQGGTRPTVTDACLALGYIDPSYFLGGAMKLDVDAARTAIDEHVASRLATSVEEGAAAIVRIATDNMVHAIEDLTINQGIDPRDAVLVGGGGAAGLNLAMIGARLGCSRVLVPDVGAALSAAGALLSDLSADFAATLFTTSDAFDFDGVGRLLAGLRGDCERFTSGGDNGRPATFELSVEARYPRQAWELEIPIPGGDLPDADAVERLVESFHHAHEQVFAVSDPGSSLELVTWRARARRPLGGDGSESLTHDEAPEEVGSRPVYFAEGGWSDAQVVKSAALAAMTLTGPAIVESSFTTVVVPPEATCEVGPSGSLIITPPGVQS